MPYELLPIGWAMVNFGALQQISFWREIDLIKSSRTQFVCLHYVTVLIHTVYMSLVIVKLTQTQPHRSDSRNSSSGTLSICRNSFVTVPPGRQLSFQLPWNRSLTLLAYSPISLQKNSSRFFTLPSPDLLLLSWFITAYNERNIHTHILYTELDSWDISKTSTIADRGPMGITSFNFPRKVVEAYFHHARINLDF